MRLVLGDHGLVAPTAPSVVGLNRTQDASVAVAQGASSVYGFQKERVTRRKHHWGRLGDLPNLYLPRPSQLRAPVDLVVECYSSDTGFARLNEYRAELTATVTFRGEPRVALVCRHLAMPPYLIRTRVEPPVPWRD